MGGRRIHTFRVEDSFCLLNYLFFLGFVVVQQHIGSVSMEASNQDLVFDLVQEAMAENREVDDDDGLISDTDEEYGRLDRRLIL
jgi:hypothetical protein